MDVLWLIGVSGLSAHLLCAQSSPLRHLHVSAPKKAESKRLRLHAIACCHVPDTKYVPPYLSFDVTSCTTYAVPVVPSVFHLRCPKEGSNVFHLHCPNWALYNGKMFQLRCLKQAQKISNLVHLRCPKICTSSVEDKVVRPRYGVSISNKSAPT